MQRDGQGSQFGEEEVDEFALRLQCSEEMDVCAEDAKPDRVDEASGRITSSDPFFGLEDTVVGFDPYYFSTKQCFLTPAMRSTLLDWLQHLCTDFCFHRHTYYLAVVATDRFLSVVANVPIQEYQLLGLAALYISSKFEEVTLRKIVEFAKSADNGYSLDSIRSMERRIFSTLRWKLSSSSSPFSALNYATWMWDAFALEHGDREDLLFHAANEHAYRRFSELVQVLDLAYMDVSALLFSYRHLALGLLYIGVIRAFHSSELQELTLDDLQQRNQEAEAAFCEFLRTTALLPALKDLFPVLDFLYQFLDLRLETLPIPDGLVLQLYEDFLSCQTYNPHSLAFIRGKQLGRV